jgi:hypothetical protein
MYLVAGLRLASRGISGGVFFHAQYRYRRVRELNTSLECLLYILALKNEFIAWAFMRRSGRAASSLGLYLTNGVTAMPPIGFSFDLEYLLNLRDLSSQYRDMLATVKC